MIQLWTGSVSRTRRVVPMHDLLIALAFMGIVIAPAIVAANSGTDSAVEPE